MKLRLVKGGIHVAARIYLPACHCTPVGGEDQIPHEWTDKCDRSPPRLVAEIGGEEVLPISRVWDRGDFITEAKYQQMIDTAAWAEAFDKNDPAANPHKAINLDEMEPIAP